MSLYVARIEETKRRLYDLVPAYYRNNDTGEIMKGFIYAMARVLEGPRNLTENFESVIDPRRMRIDLLEFYARNYGFEIDREDLLKQRAFVDLAAQYADIKGTFDSIKSLMRSYGFKSDIVELYFTKLLYGAKSDGDIKLTAGSTRIKQERIYIPEIIEIGNTAKRTFYINPNGSNESPYDTFAKGALNFFELFYGGIFPASPRVDFGKWNIVEVGGASISELFDPTDFGGLPADSHIEFPKDMIIKMYSGNVDKPIITMRRALFYRMNGGVFNDIVMIKDMSSAPPNSTSLMIADTSEEEFTNIERCSFRYENVDFGSDASLYIANKKAMITNNTFIGSGSGFMRLWNTKNAIVANNSMYDFSSKVANSDGILIFNDPGAKIFNNIIQGIGYGRGLTMLGVQCIADYNCFYNVGSKYGGLAVAGGNDIEANPLFNDPSGFDLTLQDGSPCIDVGAGYGIYKESPLIDYNGVVRPINITDIGAFER